MIEPRCIQCHKPYPPIGLPFRCPDCGGLFDYLDLPEFKQDQINRSAPGIWRYAHVLGLPQSCRQISIGEGGTPLIWRSCFGREIGFKLEFMNPSGSFKDRGSAVIASLLLSRGINRAVEDSSGNAGASFAAYAAAGGIQAQIFVPDIASGPKLKQMEAFGAQVVRVPGSRARTSEVTLQAVEAGGVYASHAYLPHNLLGYATLAYELYEELDREPGTVVLPAGQGGLLLGVNLGFRALKMAGCITKIPQMIGVQALACAPIYNAFIGGSTAGIHVVEGITAAEGIRVSRPVRIEAVIEAVRLSQGKVLAVGEPEIPSGRGDLARLGFYVEPTSAVVWDAVRQVSDSLVGPVVAVLTGSGLKSA